MGRLTLIAIAGAYPFCRPRFEDLKINQYSRSLRRALLKGRPHPLSGLNANGYNHTAWKNGKKG